MWTRRRNWLSTCLDLLQCWRCICFSMPMLGGLNSLKMECESQFYSLLSSYSSTKSFWIHPTLSCCSCHLFLGQRNGSMAWNDTWTEKDAWLALNQSIAKYLGQTKVPKGSTWALESPGWARAGVKKRKVTTGLSWPLPNPLLSSHPQQCWASLNLHLCLIWQPKLHSGQRMTPWSDAAKQGLTDWGSVYSLQKIASWSWIRNNITFLWSWSWNYPF